MKNRQIKFRAWNQKENKFEDYICFQYENLNLIFNEDSNWKFQQFTGLKDKNGVEIYEGDILKGKLIGGWSENEPYSFIGKVIFAEHCQYQVRLCDKSQEYTPEINDTFKVIGNIFQNPELIKN